MTLLLSYLDELLAMGSLQEVHIWDMTRAKEDTEFVRGLGGDGVVVFGGPPESSFATSGYSRVWSYYVPGGDGFSPHCPMSENDVVITKIDDDVVFIDTASFPEYTSYIHSHPDMFMVHANVVNNVVAAHYQARHSADIASEMPKVIAYPPGGFCGNLWDDPDAALRLHQMFLGHPERFHWKDNASDDCIKFQAPDVHDGQGRFSVNFLGGLWSALRHVGGQLSGCMSNDDEHCLTTVATEYHRNLPECMYTPLNVAHATFGSQTRVQDTVTKLYTELYERRLKEDRKEDQPLRAKSLFERRREEEPAPPAPTSFYTKRTRRLRIH